MLTRNLATVSAVTLAMKFHPRAARTDPVTFSMSISRGPVHTANRAVHD